MFFPALLTLLAWNRVAHGHTVAWARGMYCFDDPYEPNPHNQNTNTAVGPLWDLHKSEWWFQADRGCDKTPPAEGLFLELPAGGTFTVEMAHNRGQTSFSFDGRFTSRWPDGYEHPDDWSGPGNPPGCIGDRAGAMHTNNESMAAGTVFAISYNSEISRVTMENLVVFTVLPNTPWRRIATYSVPADLPPCPEGGCTCAWGWVPKGCGQENIYMAGYKCKVTGSRSTRTLAPARPPWYCGTNSRRCVRGAKQIMVFTQKDGNNVVKPQNAWVAYDETWGFSPGAQDDIFR